MIYFIDFDTDDLGLIFNFDTDDFSACQTSDMAAKGGAHVEAIAMCGSLRLTPQTLMQNTTTVGQNQCM